MKKDVKIEVMPNGYMILSRYTDLEGGFEIHCHLDGKVQLFEIPVYGGEPRDEGFCDSVQEALLKAFSWA